MWEAADCSSVAVVLDRGDLSLPFPSRRHLVMSKDIFGVISAAGVLLALSGQRIVMPLNILWCTGQPHTKGLSKFQNVHSTKSKKPCATGLSVSRHNRYRLLTLTACISVSGTIIMVKVNRRAESKPFTSCWGPIKDTSAQIQTRGPSLFVLN